MTGSPAWAIGAALVAGVIALAGAPGIGVARAAAPTQESAVAAPASPSSAPPATTRVLATPAAHRRTPDQTFLTFPEWFLVHSPAEYAAYLTSGARPSRFPLFAHIGQFWRAYAAVDHEIARFPFNGGYHVMVMVIGTSTTVEYAMKGVYEHTIGRLAETTASAAVPEERFAAAYAQAYVDFIRVDPWYKFDFVSPLKQLWTAVPLRGPNLTRRWERRFALTSELIVKAGYARLIKLGTQTVFDAPLPVTAVALTKAPASDAGHADFNVLATDHGAVLATIPRYEGFTTYGRWLAAQGIDFREIAGNDGEIAVSLIAAADWPAPPSSRVVFVQPILTRPGRQRFFVVTPVAQLATLLRSADRQRDVTIEHVYDF